jgi:hypothetical protein
MEQNCLHLSPAWFSTCKKAHPKPSLFIALDTQGKLHWIIVAVPASITGPKANIVRGLPENYRQALFVSPEFYPVSIDVHKRSMDFVRMSPETYRNSIFLDARTQHLGKDVYQIRLDDILLEAASTSSGPRRVHYIFHPAFCCSTLLARYFELVPACLVLKEPSLLTQMALMRNEATADWEKTLHMSVRLLTRAYASGGLVVIKTHEPCNAIAADLLERDGTATATFLTSPARQFVLAVLKSQFRRKWVRTRVPGAAAAAQCQPLIHLRQEDLTDAQAAAYLWLVNRYICKQLCAGKHHARVVCLEADHLADFPLPALNAVMLNAGLTVDGQMLKMMVEHPSIQRHSKDMSRPFDANKRHEDMAELERRFGAEADAALEWLPTRERECDLSGCI